MVLNGRVEGTVAVATQQPGIDDDDYTYLYTQFIE